MNVICMGLAFLFAIAALAQPGTVRVGMQPAQTVGSRR